MIGIHHCPTCGCGTHWKTLGEDFGNARKEAAPSSSFSRMGVPARMLDGFDVGKVEVRLLNNIAGLRCELSLVAPEFCVPEIPGVREICQLSFLCANSSSLSALVAF